jgi:hypothetical protein
MDIEYVQCTHIFRYVKVDICWGKNWLCLWLEILAFTLGVANLKMIVRRSDPGVADIVAMV